MLSKQISSFVLTAALACAVAGCDQEPQYENVVRFTVEPSLAVVTDWTLEPRLGVVGIGEGSDEASWLNDIDGFAFRWGDRVVADIAVVPPRARVADALASYRVIRVISRTSVPNGFQYSLCLSSCLVQYSDGDQVVRIGRGSRSFDVEVGEYADEMALIATAYGQSRATLEISRRNDEVTHTVVSVELGENEPLSGCPFLCSSSASAP